MARIVPLDAVMKISARYGGTRMYLARDPAPDSELVRLVGGPVARALGTELGGAEIEIPRARAVHHKIRNPEIRRLRSAGASLNDLALRFGLTTRQLRRICNGNPRRGGRIAGTPPRARAKASTGRSGRSSSSDRGTS